LDGISAIGIPNYIRVSERVILAILSSLDIKPVSIVTASSESLYVVVCDHAGYQVPLSLKGLGIAESDLKRHIGWDIGALGVAKKLSEMLEASLIWQNYSRLVVDCNRVLDHPGLVASESEATIISGNKNVSPANLNSRIAEIYEPYHNAIKGMLDSRRLRGVPTILVSVHSFTPIFFGRKRMCELGILHGTDSRYADAVLESTKTRLEFSVMANEPYRIDQKDCTIPMHALARGIPHVLLEIRQDLIANGAQQESWGTSLAVILEDATSSFLKSPDLS
jgi:predicted N-formylglutamate amidohydrolase